MDFPGRGRSLGKHFMSEDTVGTDSKNFNIQLFEDLMMDSHGCQFCRSNKCEITGVEEKNYPVILIFSQMDSGFIPEEIGFRLKIGCRHSWFYHALKPPDIFRPGAFALPGLLRFF